MKQPDAFDNPNWLFEVKYDGFRSLAFIGEGTCQLISRKGHKYDRFKSLARSLSQLPHQTVLDDEIACVDENGLPQFDDLYFANRPALFFAFDILALDGNDVRESQCMDRKGALRGLTDEGVPRLHYVDYVDHVEETGVRLYEMICKPDM